MDRSSYIDIYVLLDVFLDHNIFVLVIIAIIRRIYSACSFTRSGGIAVLGFINRLGLLRILVLTVVVSINISTLERVSIRWLRTRREAGTFLFMDGRVGRKKKFWRGVVEMFGGQWSECVGRYSRWWYPIWWG